MGFYPVIHIVVTFFIIYCCCYLCWFDILCFIPSFLSLYYHVAIISYHGFMFQVDVGVQISVRICAKVAILNVYLELRILNFWLHFGFPCF